MNEPCTLEALNEIAAPFRGDRAAGAVFAALRDVGTGTLAGIAEECLNDPDGHQSVLLAVVSRWLELDAPAAATFVFQPLPLADRVIKLAAAKLATQPLQTAKNLLNLLTKEEQLGQAKRTYLAVLGRHQPAMAFRLERGDPAFADCAGSPWDKSAPSALSAWAAQDSAAALAALRSVPVSEWRAADVYTLTRELASSNPAEAFRFLQTLPPVPGVDHTLGSPAVDLFAKWSETDAAAASEALIEYLHGTESHVVGATWLSGKSGPDQMISYVFGALAQRDLSAACRNAQCIPQQHGREIAFKAIGREAPDVDALVALARSLPSDAARHTLLDQAGLRFLANDQEAAVRWFATLTEADLDWHTADSVRELAAAREKESPEAAVEWAQSLPAGEPRNEATVRVMGEWLEADPEKAKRFVLGKKNPAHRQHLISMLAAAWVTSIFGNRAEGAEWVRTLSPDDRAVACRAVLSQRGSLLSAELKVEFQQYCAAE